MKVNLFHLIVIIAVSLILGFLASSFINYQEDDKTKTAVLSSVQENPDSYWFELHRKSNREFLYFGAPGIKEKSKLIREFNVKTGVPGKKPTPLPKLLGREYWVLISKMDSSYDPETSPYFLTLDIPITDIEPFGPANYMECNGQCNWEKPGFFGLHGVGGDPQRLSQENEGSSGCIRHSDEDITYLYQLLDPTRAEIRYYIQDI